MTEQRRVQLGEGVAALRLGGETRRSSSVVPACPCRREFGHGQTSAHMKIQNKKKSERLDVDIEGASAFRVVQMLVVRSSES